MFDLLKGALLKVLALGGLLLAAYAAYQKSRADRAQRKAQAIEQKAKVADARHQAHLRLQERREEIRAEQQKRRQKEREGVRKGDRNFMNNNWSWLLAVLLLAGCKEIVYLPAEPSDCPARPVLTAITEDELACLSDETALKLWERQDARRAYAEELEAFCRRPEGSE